jgi:phosphoribosylanthranilate isomerase
MNLRIKVCGLAENEDLVSLSRSGIDYAGFIFVPSSPRYAAGKIDPQLAALLSRSVPALKKTGVFLDEEVETILAIAEEYSLDAVQLHGNESPETCALLSEKREVIKTFSIAGATGFDACADYEGVCSFFLFDTAGPLAGGNGTQFDWSLLNSYEGSTPFFLSGGIGLQDVLRIDDIRHSQFAGIDVNSRFEIYPGKKDISRLQSFLHAFKPQRYELPGF